MGTLFTELFSSATSSSSGSLRKNKELSGIRVHAFDRHTQVTETGRSVTSKPVSPRPAGAIQQSPVSRTRQEGLRRQMPYRYPITESSRDGESLRKGLLLALVSSWALVTLLSAHTHTYILGLPEPHTPLEPEPGAAGQNPPQKGRKQSQWQVFLHARVKARLDSPYST